MKLKEAFFLITAKHTAPDVVEKPSVIQPSPELTEPAMYHVVILNDDYTPMDFVVMVLQRYFHKTHDAATKMMLEIHHQGRSICGMYTLDIAQTKVHQVRQHARKEGHPLACILEVI